MYIQYNDIISRISEQPVWWLEGVPRYDKFKPQDVNVYAKEVLLVHVRCLCDKDYHIGLFRSEYLIGKSFSQHLTFNRDLPLLGDPPNACCSPSANAIGIGILEFWECGTDYVWKRLPEFERSLLVGEHEIIEDHQEAWRRIRVYEARKAGSRPEWKPPSLHDMMKEKLTERLILGLEDTGNYKNIYDLRERYRLLFLAATGRITHEEFIELEQIWTVIKSRPSALVGMSQEQVIKHVTKMLSQPYHGSEELIDLRKKHELYKSRQELNPPSWANELIDEYHSIENLILSQGVAGYKSMSKEEREEQFCSGLSRRLQSLAHTGRITHGEYHHLIPMLRRNLWD